ncbi:inner kinetochore subunit Nkp1p [Monosporozyma unispora]|nr:hypothetical protein C6P44_001617 [Kazachstania unispora]
MSDTINQHEELSNFIHKQVSIIVDSTKESNQSKIPSEVLNIINNKLNQLRSTNITQIAQDIITQNVINNEYDKNLGDRTEIIKSLHIRNIAKLNNKINSQFLNRDDQGSMNYYNLDYLIENINKLPELVTENDDETKNQIKEYKILREELINHCHAIRIGENELENLKLQCNKLSTLQNAIRESTGSDDMTNYIKSYDKKVLKELEELIYNLENKIKSLDSDDIVEIRKLQSILKTLK